MLRFQEEFTTSKRIALPLLLVVLLASATAHTASADGPPFDLAAGVGELALGTLGTPFTHIDAKRTGTDTETQGHFGIKYPKDDARFPSGGSVRGSFYCMHIEGNTAFLLGIVEASELTNVWAVGDYVAFGVVDNGAPGTGSVADGVNFSVGLGVPPIPPPPFCGANPGAIPDLRNVKGNFVVQLSGT